MKRVLLVASWKLRPASRVLGTLPTSVALPPDPQPAAAQAA